MYVIILEWNLHPQVVKNVTNCDVTFVEAFTVDNDDNARYPEKNFLRVVPDELQKQNFTVLILSCGPNEVSNLNTNLDYSKNIEDWRKRVKVSSVKMYELAEWCLSAYPSLEKVVIVKRPPRYDNAIKAHLSEFANNTLDEIWKEKGSNRNIAISRQDLDCDGDSRFRVYGDPFYNNYDGVHMRGKLAIQLMTRTFINMMTKIFPHLKPENQRHNNNNGYAKHINNNYSHFKVNRVGFKF